MHICFRQQYVIINGRVKAGSALSHLVFPRIGFFAPWFSQYTCIDDKHKKSEIRLFGDKETQKLRHDDDRLGTLPFITKTYLFKYTENFTAKKRKFSDEKF